ncbi:MAG: START domain-containing protein [Bdellovibrionota bacterium]|nr:START domain-containing protein [Bdellovibrionota bacterium]
MKNNFKLLLSLYTLLLVSLSPFVRADSVHQSTNIGDDGKWEKSRIRRGFTIYVRDREAAKSDILPIKVEGIINAPIASIMENLRTVEGSEDWTPDLLKKTTLKDLGPREAITYSLTDMSWPVYDRTLILHNKLHLDKERKLLFVLSKTVPHKKAPQPERTIEAFVGYSNMGFRPVSRNKTYVELTAFIDPRGSIPSWLINFYQTSWPVDFLEAVEKRANEHNNPLRPGLQTMLDELLSLMKWDGETYTPLASARP